MYPAAGRGTTQATVNSAPLEPFDACKWVSPSVAADLGQIFDTHRYLGEYDTLLVSSVATNTAITASSSRQQVLKKNDIRHLRSRSISGFGHPAFNRQAPNCRINYSESKPF